MISIVIGIVLLGIGQYLCRKYVGYSDLLMGGGIVVLYLSIFSAHFFYQLVLPATAGVFMFVVTVLSFAISIYNATIVLAPGSHSAASPPHSWLVPYGSVAGTVWLFEHCSTSASSASHSSKNGRN